MEVTQDNHTGIHAQPTGDCSLSKSPVVNLISCGEDQISSDNLIHLAQLPATDLSGTSSVALGRYINFSDAQNLLHPGNDEGTQIQFLVIHGQSEAVPTQSLDAQDRPTEDTEECSKDLPDSEKGKDRLICGQCQKVCLSVLEFLEHKGTHIGRGLGLGCEVCSLTFSRTKSLQDHYRRKHKIKLTDCATKTHTSKPDCKSRKKTLRKLKSALISTVEEQGNDGAMVEETVNETVNTAITSNTEGETNDVNNDENEITEDIIDGVGTTRKPYLNMETDKYDESQVEDMLESDTEHDVNQNQEWVISRDLSVPDKSLELTHACSGNLSAADTETAVLQSVSQATDVNHVQLSEVTGTSVHVDCVTINPDLVERDNFENGNNVPSVQHRELQVRNNVPNVSQGELLTGNGDILNGFSGIPSCLEKENTRFALENVQQATDEVNSVKTFKDLSKDNSLLQSFTKMNFDHSNELEMPDFYFIAVIERGPRNSIKGCKYHFQCLYCELKLSWRNKMCQHMREKHSEILELGPVLNISQSHVENKHKIIKMSEYVKLEKTRSGKRFRGIETQDLPGDFPCGKCGKMFHRLRYLRKHENLHRAEKNLLCSICVKSFKTLANLNQHMRTHKEREAYKCSQCDFESTINIAIHAHRQLHKDGCVICDICGCAYNDKSTLTKHKKVHDISRPYACTHPGCTWRFKSKSMCSAHVKAHTTKPNFECKICHYAFRQKHHLQRHEIKIHNITSNENKCMYTVLPVSFVDEGVIVTDETKLLDMESKPIQREVSLIINEGSEVSVDQQFDLESALQNGQLVIATDSDGNTINYEMGDMGLNVSYQTLLPESDRQQMDSQTILLPQTDSGQMDSQTILLPQTDSGQILYQHEEVTETICTEVNTSIEAVS